MADIVIRGMNMPKTEEDSKLLILSPNEITELNGLLGERNPKHNVIELPPHGRLVDVCVLINRYPELAVDFDKAPTVIPADKDGET